MNVYVASSWRNEQPQQTVCKLLRQHGHDVYDFRHPAPGNTGFRWSEIDPHYAGWTPTQFRAALGHPIAADGFAFDMNALRAADACVLVLPCGRSAHLELGFAVGAGKNTFVYAPPDVEFTLEPELMYLMCDALITNSNELVLALSRASVPA